MPGTKAFLTSVPKGPWVTILTVTVCICSLYPHAGNKLDPSESVWGNCFPDGMVLRLTEPPNGHIRNYNLPGDARPPPPPPPPPSPPPPPAPPPALHPPRLQVITALSGDPQENRSPGKLWGDGYVHYLDCGLLPIQEGCLWPSESTVSGNGIPEVSPSTAYPPSLSQVMEGDSLRPLLPRPLSWTPLCPVASLPQAGGTSPVSRVAARGPHLLFSEEPSWAAGMVPARTLCGPQPQQAALNLCDTEGLGLPLFPLCDSPGIRRWTPGSAPYPHPHSPESRVIGSTLHQLPNTPTPTLGPAARGGRTLTWLLPSSRRCMPHPGPPTAWLCPPSPSGTASTASSPPTRTCSTRSICHPPSRCRTGRSPHPTRAPARSSCGTPSSSWS